MYNVFGGHGRGRARSSFLDRVSELYQVELKNGLKKFFAMNIISIVSW